MDRTSEKTGGSNADRIFFMKYPMSFFQYWYSTFPPPHQDTSTTGSPCIFCFQVDQCDCDLIITTIFSDCSTRPTQPHWRTSSVQQTSATRQHICTDRADTLQTLIQERPMDKYNIHFPLEKWMGLVLRCENRPVNRAVNRDTGLEMPCCPVTDLLWV